MSQTGRSDSLSEKNSFCGFCPGYCCYKLKGATLLIQAVDINRLARHLHTTDGDIRRKFLVGKHSFKTRIDGSCIFLANDRMCKRCTIHEARPDQCRKFPYGKACPYLNNVSILTQIQPRIEKSLLKITSISF